MKTFPENAVVLKHALPTRLFHWCLVFGFIPAAITGVILFLRPFGADLMSLSMKIHIVGAWILMISCLLFFLFQPKRVVAFWREIFSWRSDDIEWMKKSGGYPQKIFLGKTVPVPPMRKMNSGQKLMGIFVFFGTLTLIATGVILYLALPLVPKEIAWHADKIHLAVGLFLTACVFFGHIPLGLYNIKECLCMFGDGTMKVEEAKHHNALWVEEDIVAVKGDIA